MASPSLQVMAKSMLFVYLLLSFYLAHVYQRYNHDQYWYSSKNLFSSTGNTAQLRKPSAGSSSIPAAFNSILARAKRAQSQCSVSQLEKKKKSNQINGKQKKKVDLPDGHRRLGGETVLAAAVVAPKNMTPMFPTLPEHGIVNAMRYWKQSTSTQPTHYNHDIKCKMPPTKSCNVTSFSIVIMTHNTRRFSKLMVALTDIFPTWREIGMNEIIFVWNAPKRSLVNAAKNATQFVTNETRASYNGAAQLLQWHTDPTHPFRIFYAREHHLKLRNNLLNRYHPSIKPKNEAIVYYDDDGPFLQSDVVVAKSGFELWKRNSDVQVGSSGRYLTFSSGNLFHEFKSQRDLFDATAQNFSPLCLSSKRRQVKYNRDYFSDFDSSIILPTGSIIHRNYLCYIWHPALEEVRKFILDHPTHPDDVFVSLLIAQLSGKGPRQYPSRRKNEAEERIFCDKMKRRYPGTKGICGEKKKNQEDSKNANEGINITTINYHSDVNHRRLLWERTNWFEQRVHAANTLLGYFGTIHPGSVGWCDTSGNSIEPNGSVQHRSNNESNPYLCNPGYPSVELLPWMNKWSSSYKQCLGKS